MRRTILSFSFFLLAGSASAQYKNDNVLFKTVFPQDLCKELSKNPGYLLLDVRSPGEYSDTSSFTGLNLGHLDGAMNIDIRQISNRINEISAYKNKPVFVYCSHSQRSRRVSKMLADSGFTNVNNINGGITAIHLLTADSDCLHDALVSANKYSILSPQTICKKLSSNSGSVYLLDVRPDSAWGHSGSNAKMNATGYFRGTHHIALANLKARLNEIPKDKEILITDLFGNDAASAATILQENHFENLGVMLEGFDRWFLMDKSNLGCNKDVYVPAVQFNVMSSGEFSSYYPSAKNILLLDVRSAEEFSNKHKDAFRNIGHLKNALNIPAAELSARIQEIEKYRSSPVVVYAFSGAPEAYAAAGDLIKSGFKNVKVLAGGLFNLRWSASNVPGLAFMHSWVVDVPDENK